MKTTRKPTVCLCCDGEDFDLVQSLVEQEFRGETLRVPAQVWRCRSEGCAHETLVPGQLDALRVATADTYRQQHGLLTSGEIRALRERTGLSQRKFAEAVGVGPASIPRWESWKVQEPVYDEKMRAFASNHTRPEARTVVALHRVGGFRYTMTPVETTKAAKDWWKLDQGVAAWQPELDLPSSSAASSYHNIPLTEDAVIA